MVRCSMGWVWVGYGKAWVRHKWVWERYGMGWLGYGLGMAWVGYGLARVWVWYACPLIILSVFILLHLYIVMILPFSAFPDFQKI